jgi:hypothetical protein
MPLNDGLRKISRCRTHVRTGFFWDGQPDGSSIHPLMDENGSDKRWKPIFGKGGVAQRGEI